MRLPQGASLLRACGRAGSGGWLPGVCAALTPQAGAAAQAVYGTGQGRKSASSAGGRCGEAYRGQALADGGRLGVRGEVAEAPGQELVAVAVAEEVLQQLPGTAVVPAGAGLYKAHQFLRSGGELSQRRGHLRAVLALRWNRGAGSRWRVQMESAGNGTTTTWCCFRAGSTPLAPYRGAASVPGVPYRGWKQHGCLLGEGGIGVGMRSAAGAASWDVCGLGGLEGGPTEGMRRMQIDVCVRLAE